MLCLLFFLTNESLLFEQSNTICEAMILRWRGEAELIGYKANILRRRIDMHVFSVLYTSGIDFDLIKRFSLTCCTISFLFFIVAYLSSMFRIKICIVLVSFRTVFQTMNDLVAL